MSLCPGGIAKRRDQRLRLRFPERVTAVNNNVHWQCQESNHCGGSPQRVRNCIMITRDSEFT
jgi:hypothetical protein